MAKFIQAFTAYGPKINLIAAMDAQTFMKMITKRTTLSSGVVKIVQESEVETLIDFLLEGRPVHTGIAIFTPSIDLDGNFSVSVRVDKRIIAALNIPGAFKGDIQNSMNIGLSTQEISAKWDADNPTNHVENLPAPEA